MYNCYENWNGFNIVFFLNINTVYLAETTVVKSFQILFLTEYILNCEEDVTEKP